LDADGAATGEAAEWQWSIDDGLWRPYQRDPQPTLVAPEFLLQGHHTIDVRARPVGDYVREDRAPVRLSVLIDSVPPTLAPAVEDGVLVLHGSDLVTPDALLRYQVRPVGASAWTALADG